MPIKRYPSLLRLTYHKYAKINSQLLAAGLSYFAVFSIPPIMVIVVTLSTYVMGKSGNLDVILGTIEFFVGQRATESLARFLWFNQPESSASLTFVSFFLLLLGASGVFMQLQTALNAIWWKGRRGGFLRFRFHTFVRSLMMVFGFGLCMLFLLLVRAGMAALSARLPHISSGFWKGLNAGLTFLWSVGFLTLLFKFGTRSFVPWKASTIGAALTSAMLLASKVPLTFYFVVKPESVYGVAAVSVAIFLWVYFSAAAFLFGASFTWAYAYRQSL